MIRIVIIDDHSVVADSLEATLGAQDDLEVVGVANSGTSGLELVIRHRPDVALIDFRLADTTGAELTRSIKEVAPECHSVILTGTGLERALLESIDAGAVGFATKDQRFSEVVAMIRAAADGKVQFPADLLAKVLPNLRRDPTARSRLSKRERDVLAQIAAGFGNAEIGENLYISVNTVRNHIASILTKLDAKTRGEAVAIAVREGLITIAEISDPQ